MIIILFGLGLLLALSAGLALLKAQELRRQESLIIRLEDYSIDRLCLEVSKEIGRVLSADIAGLNLNHEETLKREHHREELRRAVANACLGSRGDREYMKDYIESLLTKRFGIGPGMIGMIIPFDEPELMTPADKFEYMYSRYSKVYGSRVFEHMAEDFAWQGSVIGAEDIEAAYRTCSYEGGFADQLETVAQRCYQLLYGHDCVDLLIMDDSVDGVSGGIGGRTRLEYNYMDELLTNMSSRPLSSRNCDKVYCVLHGRLIRLAFLSFESSHRLERVVRNIYRYNTKTALSSKDPVLNSSLSNNARVVVTRPPVSDGWSFYVRKFASSEAKKLESLLTHANADKIIALLKLIVANEYNFVVSGNTGGGKTTLVKALVGAIDPRYAIRVVETSFETDLNNLYPERNIHVMQERGSFSIYDAITATRKMDTDVILIGEVNEPKLAGAYVQVAQSGSRMAITTLHHESTQALIEYMRNALVAECGITDSYVAEKQVVDVLDFDIHMIRDMEGNHYIERITEIVARSYGAYPRDPIEARAEFFSRITDRQLYECRNIVEFDKELGRYRICNLPAAAEHGVLRRELEDLLGNPPGLERGSWYQKQ